MKIITAPDVYNPEKYDVTCFLAGGITNCHDWQKDVIDSLLKSEQNGLNLENLVIINPRRSNFPIDNEHASVAQIMWEFNLIEKCDLFSMYFTSGESDQPICLYELGRNIVRMKERFPLSWHERMIVSVENGYKRETDVVIQSKLATGKNIVTQNATVNSHVHNIIMGYTWAIEDL